MCHPPEFDFVQHTFGFVMGHTYQRLLVNGYELIPGSQAAILKEEERAADVISSIVCTASGDFSNSKTLKHDSEATKQLEQSFKQQCSLNSPVSF